MVAGFEFGEKDRLFLCGACSAHEAAALERLELADVRSGVTEGPQVSGGERFGVTLLEIQSVNQRRAFQHDSHTGVAAFVDAASVGLGAGLPMWCVSTFVAEFARIRIV